MSGYVLIVDIEVQDGKMEEFLPLMRENARASVADEPGCRQFDVSRVDGEPNRVMLYEVYDNEAAFQAHHNQPRLATFLGKIRPLLTKTTRTVLTRFAGNAKA